MTTATADSMWWLGILHARALSGRDVEPLIRGAAEVCSVLGHAYERRGLRRRCIVCHRP